MKKSIFKRTVASATGILLAATQLGVLATTVGAADAITIDASYLTNVPVNVNPITGILEYTNGDWYDLLFAAYTAADALDQEIALDSAKNTVKDLVGAYVSEDTLNAVLNAVSSAKIVGETGVYTITATVDECGEAVAKKIVGKAAANVDWTGYSVAGTITAVIDMTTENTISYTASFTDETGAVYTIDTIGAYVAKKGNEALAIAGVTSNKVNNKVANAAAKLAAVEAISVSASDFNTAYTEYTAALQAALGTNKNIPATLAEAVAHEKVNAAFNAAVEQINANQNVGVVDLTVADLAGIAAGAYDINVTANGLAADAAFSIADDQSAELLAAFQEYYGEDLEKLNTLSAYFAEEYDLTNGSTYSIAAITSHKEITLTVSDSALTYDIIRVIDSITLTETPAVTPDPVYTYTLNVNGMPQDGGIYWSDETEAFNLFDVDLSLTVLKDGVEVGTLSNLTEYFAPDAASASEVAYTGYGQYDITLALSEEGYADLYTLVDANGYDADALADSGIAVGTVADSFSVTLVTRGDSDLDGDVDVVDTTATLQTYIYDRVMDLQINVIVDKVGIIAAEDFDAAYYAMDVDGTGGDANGNCVVEQFDVINTLRYYVLDYMNKPITWTEQVGFEATHTQNQHFNPTAELMDNIQDGDN